MDKIGRMFLRHFTTFARVNMLIKMKKNYLLWAVTALIMLALQSCNNGKTYAEMKEEEADAINKYIVENNIEEISEAEFAAQDSVTYENQYVLLEESGVYMHIDNRGPGKGVLEDGYHEILARFVEVALQTRSDLGMEAGDTLLANFHVSNPAYTIYGELFKLTISDESYSASFANNGSNKSIMYDVYGTQSVPSGWLIPFRYLTPGRTTDSDKIARVKLIVPHSQGTSSATQSVYPCFYELTYSLK